MLQTRIELPSTGVRRSRLSAAARSMWLHKWSAVALLVMLSVAAWMLGRWAIGPEVAVYSVVRADLVKIIVASGHVETPFRVNIGSQITGTVTDVLVEEGQTVKRGQSLIALDSSELKAMVAAAEAAEAQASAGIRQLRDFTLPSAEQALKQAQATLVNAQATYQRAKDLLKSGFGTREVLDGATKNLDVARTQVRTAELKVEATLSYINPSVDIARASVEVKLTVPHPPAYLRQDMTISVDIAVDRRRSTLIVPARVVHDATSSAPWVLIVRNGRAREQAVQLGLRASDQIEILRGLEQGERVIPIAAGVRAGQHVRPVTT